MSFSSIDFNTRNSTRGCKLYGNITSLIALSTHIIGLQMHRYCVDISKPRPMVRADTELFSAIDASNSSVPIVLVLTRKDDFIDRIIGRLGKELKKSRPELTEDERDAIVTDKAHKALVAEAESFKNIFCAETKSPLLGPVTTGKGTFVWSKKCRSRSNLEH